MRKARRDDPATSQPAATTLASNPLVERGLAGELLVVTDESCVTVRLPRLQRGGSERCTLEYDSPRPEGASLVGREELERAARRHPNVPAAGAIHVDVEDVAWLSRTRVVVRLTARARGPLAFPQPQPLLAIFDSGRVVRTRAHGAAGPARLVASPGGRYVAFAPGIVLRRDGSEVSLPRGLVQARAVAWSPDGRWLALAQRGSVVLVEVASLERYDRTGGGLRTFDVPVAARDLAWR